MSYFTSSLPRHARRFQPVLGLAVVVMLCLASSIAWGQTNDPKAQTKADQPATSPSTDDAAAHAQAPASSHGATQAEPSASHQQDDSSAKTLDTLIGQMKESPLIEPTSTSNQATKQGADGQPSKTAVDPNIAGIAPEVRDLPPTTRREGEFIMGRQGRLIRSKDQINTLFVFEADAKASPESPMVMAPCQLRQTMEQIASEKGGDRVKFTVSGQVLVYRGVSYLLPTMMTVTQDRGNLQ